MFVLLFGCDFERIENALHHIFGYYLTDESVYIVESEIHREWSHRRGVVVENLAANFATGTLFHEQSGKFERVGGSIWVHATLEAERTVGVQTLAARSLSHACGVEVGRFKENIGGAFCNARFETAKHTGDAHRLFGIANHQVGGSHCALNAIESGKFGTFGGCFHHYFATFHLGEVEAVERLSH